MTETEYPVYLRVGDGEEHRVGTLVGAGLTLGDAAGAMRAVADELDGRRQRRTAPHDRQVRAPRGDR